MHSTEKSDDRDINCYTVYRYHHMSIPSLQAIESNKRV